MFSSIKQKLKEVFDKMLGKESVSQILHVTPAISSEMEQRIDLWGKMYENKAPWLKQPTKDDPTSIESLGIPQLLASEKARTALLEFKSEITAPMIEDPEIQESSDTTQLNQFSQKSQNDGIESNDEEIKTDNPKKNENDAGNFGNNSNNRDNKTTFNSPQFHPSSTVKKTVPDGSTERADFLNKQYGKLLKNLRRNLEYGIAKGGLVIKPYVVWSDEPTINTKTEDAQSRDTETENTQSSNIQSGSNSKDLKQQSNDVTKQTNDVSEYKDNSTDKINTAKSTYTYSGDAKTKAEIEFDWVQADGFFPLAFNGSGDVTEAAFIQRKIDKNCIYSRLEYHKYYNHTVTIINKAYVSQSTTNTQSMSNQDLGREINLTDVPEWAGIEPETTIAGVDRLLFAYFRMPEANTVDMYSPLGISGYERAVGLIRQADIQYSRILWEYEGSELAIDIDRDALRPVEDENGETHSVNPTLQNRLFRYVDLGNDSDTYNVFSPQIRDQSLINGLNMLLMRIEDVEGVSRGTISDATQEAKTATELKILKQRSYQTNAEVQKAVQSTLEDVVYIMNVLCDLYNITPDGKYETSFEWDDSILVDVEAELGKRITLMNQGLASKVETRMWYFGETDAQAREALLKVQEENRQAVEDNIAIQSSLGRDNFDGQDNFNANNSKSAMAKKEKDNAKTEDRLRDKQPNGHSPFNKQAK